MTDRINAIKWTDYHTAYGHAGNVASQLENLFSADRKLAMDATHDLWCGLCHQHAFISSAALPAYEFLKAGLLTLEDDLKVEILDIMLGFSGCTTPEYYKGIKCEAPEWEKELRSKLHGDLQLYRELSVHANELISRFASGIVADLEVTNG